MSVKSVDSPFILLDDSRPAGLAGPSRLFHNPLDIIVANSLDAVPAALAAIDAAAASGKHVAGWIAYECAAAFEPRLAAAIAHYPDEPLIWMLVTDACETLDGAAVSDWIAGRNAGPGEAELSLGQADLDLAAYAERVATVKDYIVAGDIYQANFTFPMPCRIKGPRASIYADLRRRQPVAFGAYMETGQHTVMSVSPELFVRRDGDRLEARPMKGTAERGNSSEADRRIATGLAADPKSKAENLMIVDLLRNDLSRIAEPGTVTVDDLFTVETYPTLHQMTSGVSAACPPDLKPSQLLQALFPCGSVTGAPKIRAMEVIAELEDASRGVYCGAIGYFAPRQGAQGPQWALNVPIRTIMLDPAGRGRLPVGSGIVADSDIEKEYAECLLKAAFATERQQDPAFCLIETMRAEAGEIKLLDRHLARLQSSAIAFGMPLNAEALRQDLLNLAAGRHPQSPVDQHLARVRLTLSNEGQWSLDVSSFKDDQRTPLRVCFAATRLWSQDLMLKHKTSRRDLYDRATAWARANGYADVLFLNERGEIAEGAISNVFVQTVGGLETPPVSSGALPGVLRGHLIDTGDATVADRALLPADLEEAKAVYIGNALRGLRRVLVEPRVAQL